MARRSTMANATHANGNAPPPSTLAAQIVQNQTRHTTSQQQPEEAATFTELLHAILNDQTAAQETDVNVNAQLVNVVTQLGLAPLITEDPFAEWDRLLPQAADSIAVIEVAVKRQPEILLVQLETDGPQLLLNLLAALIAVCGRPQCQQLPIVALISSMIASFEASINFWQRASVLKEVIQECADDALSKFEALPATLGTINLRLPPPRSVGKLWPNSESSITMPSGSVTTINDVGRGFTMVLRFSEISGLQLSWQRDCQLRLQRLASKIKPQLEKAGIWERSVKDVLRLPHNWQLIATLVHEMTPTSLTPDVQSALAAAIMESLRRDSKSAKDTLVPVFLAIGRSEEWDALHQDLKISVTTWLCRFELASSLPPPVVVLRDDLCSENAMNDNELATAFKQLSVSQPCPGRRPRTRKRRKLSVQEPEPVRNSAIQRTTTILCGLDSEDPAAVPELAPSVYPKLQDHDRCVAWQSLIDLAEYELPATCLTISRLIQLPDHDTKEARVLSLLAIQACVQCSTDSQYTALRSSEFGRYWTKCMHSSIRELRIASGQILACFLREDLPEKEREDNRHYALELLRQLCDRDIANEHETLILALSQVAVACGQSELNLVLYQLVEYLGHRNMLVCALAYSEIEAIAAARKLSRPEMFQPFWGSIAVAVVRDFHSKPQKAQQLCDLLGMDINTFLVETQNHTLPAMVLTKRKDVLERIATARGKGESIRDICVQPATNLAPILAALLTQPVADIEGYANSCLADVDPKFSEIDTMIKSHAGIIAAELLKHCGDADDSRKPRAYQAFQLFANIAQASQGQRKHSSKSGRAVTSFFDSHLRGILPFYSTTMEDNGPRVPNAEKIRCLNAMAELFILSKGEVSIALPQIKACLQTGLEQPALCETAFITWLTLMPLLQEDDIPNIVDETFVMVVRHWPALTDGTRVKIHHMITELVKKHNTTLQENIMTLPSLRGIEMLKKFVGEFERLKDQESAESHIKAYSQRLRGDGDAIVLQALAELVPYLESAPGFLHDTAASEHPSPVLSDMICALLDVTLRYSGKDPNAVQLCGKALGLVGSIDPNRVEANRPKRQLLVLSNFEDASESIDWVMALLEDVLVKSFKSVTNARDQGFFAYAIQELLKVCSFRELSTLRPRNSQAPDVYNRWDRLPEHVRTALTPFLSSRYVVTTNNPAREYRREYPSFSPNGTHAQWLRSLTTDLMQKAKGDNAKNIFPFVARTIKAHDLATARFVFPFTVLNVVVGGTISEVEGISEEFLAVLTATAETPSQQECIRLCSESVFAVLDYLSTWLREKRKELAQMRTDSYKTGHQVNEMDEDHKSAQIDTIERFLGSIPAEIIATQAVDCRSYARGLFHWEQYIRQERSLIPSGRLMDKDDMMYERLQDIYSQIDEPDGLEGIAAHLPIITDEQQAFNHAKSGRWTAAQAWYELQLADNPKEVDLQQNVLRCLRETGQYAALLRYADSFLEAAPSDNEKDKLTIALKHLPSAVEACWMTEDLDGLERRLTLQPVKELEDFNVGIGRALLSFRSQGAFAEEIARLRKSIVEGFSVAGTDSLPVCHNELLKLHVLYELEALMTVQKPDAPRLLQAFDKRLAAVGSYVQDKQFILGIRRAAMRLRSQQVNGESQGSQDIFRDNQTGSLWLTTARLARQTKNTPSAYNAVLKAFDCGDCGAKLEEARLLWHEGHQRQAIQALQAAIDSNIFSEVDTDPSGGSMSTSGGAMELHGYKQEALTAKALLTLAKWLDASGQSQTKDMTDRYQLAAKRYQRWEKGHYYLGKHYSKLLEAQKALPKVKQSPAYLTGELYKLVIDNSLRSIPFGNKYWHETIPRVLTLWLQLGSDTCERGAQEDKATFDKRVKNLQACNKQLQKYVERVPAYVFYHALPQLISRMTHPHPDVWNVLSVVLLRVAAAHPSQALWSLLAVGKANDPARVSRGNEILTKLRNPKTRPKGADSSGVDLRVIIQQGQRLCDGLLRACEAPIDARVAQVSLQKTLGFDHKLAPSHLVVPIEATLTASAPSSSTAEVIRRHKAFAQDKITIQAFTDDVLVLNSLQRPRKITARGSDGKLYGLLCKPKDDLRKDQRLMEFNSIINKALKRNTESSKRRLYIKTYAVTPLSEESGTIEWVEGIKPIRDILLGLYLRKGIRPNYTEIKKDLDVASADPENAHVFAQRVLNQFPPLLHEWFTETYPEPDHWFAARLRYARSAAVMSMTGHILGLGDRHGENILLEEGTGGVFHVDFNCLFDKGLTFEKPELVPFRLTHNMEDAMGPYGYEGPFRKSSELTLGLLRQESDTLMTVLETFLYDPTTDFVGKKKRATAGVPETPEEILESVATKLKGLLRGETVPLSTEGYVDALIQEATDHFRLASMYIGWCSFL